MVRELVGQDGLRDLVRFLAARAVGCRRAHAFQPRGNVGHFRTNLGRIWPCSGQTWSTSSLNWSNSDRCWSVPSQIWSKLVKLVDSGLVESGRARASMPKLVELDPKLAASGPITVDVDQAPAKFIHITTKCWSIPRQVWSCFADVGPNLVDMGQELVDVGPKLPRSSMATRQPYGRGSSAARVAPEWVGPEWSIWSNSAQPCPNSCNCWRLRTNVARLLEPLEVVIGVR